MAEKPAFEKPKTTEDLVQLYDYVYQESAEPLIHPGRGTGRIGLNATLKPYGSHSYRDKGHLEMIYQMRKLDGWKKPNEYTVLDASCGRGHLLQTLNKEGFECHGTEVSDYLLKNDLKYLPVAKASYDDILTVCGPESFDIVITNDVLEHLVDEEMLDRAVTNLCAVSKKWLCISVGLGHSPATKYPTALGLKVRGLHEIRKDREWWAEYFTKYLKEVVPLTRRKNSPFHQDRYKPGRGRRPNMGFFLGGEEMKRPRNYVKIFGRYYEEPNREQRDWIAIKGRRTKGPVGVRYLHEYLRDAHGVDRYGQPLEKSEFKEPDLSFAAEAAPAGSVISSTMEGLEAETDVELLRRKVVRLANALAETEKERDYLRNRLSKIEAAMANCDNVIFSDIDSSSDKAKKLDLLKVVFEENKKLRKDLGGE